MKKYLFLLLSVITYGQTYQNPTFGTITTKTAPTTTADPYVGSINASGVIGKVAPENIPVNVIPPTTHYTPTTSTLKGHFQGIDNAIGNIPLTTAGNTTRVWFTGDATTIGAGTFYLTNPTNKGTVANVSQSVINDDNQKKYFTQDLIGQPFATTTIFPAGVYAGNLSASTTPNSAQQRFTVELYKCNNAGTPIASGVPGAPVGDLGVTVVIILDSGNLTLADGSVTNVPVSASLASQFSIASGERIRYHVSAEKVGTASSNITESVWYGNSFNSFLDVPTPITSSGVSNLSTVTGATVTVALDNLNTEKVSGSGTSNFISKWSGANTQSNSQIQDDGVGIGYNSAPSSTIKHQFSAPSSEVYAPSSVISSTPTAQFFFGNPNMSTGTHSLFRFSSNNANSQSGFIYLGTFSTSTNFESTFVLGRRTGASSYSESLRVTPVGNLLINSTTDDLTNKLQVGGSAKITDLAGTGRRIVVADAGGKLSIGVNQIIITTASSITTATTDSSGVGQDGKHVLISNGSTAINLTCNGGVTTSYGKVGSGSITFVQGSGRTLVQLSGTAIMNGALGSTATLWSNGTTDYLAITNY